MDFWEWDEFPPPLTCIDLTAPDAPTNSLPAGLMLTVRDANGNVVLIQVPREGEYTGIDCLFAVEIELPDMMSIGKVIFVDKGYTGEKAARAAEGKGIGLEMIKPPDVKKGFLRLHAAEWSSRILVGERVFAGWRGSTNLCQKA
jgi:hypothetical protein